MGMRKPERRIYELTLQRLGVQGPEAVFLDDIGQNLKGAAQLGIRGIKVRACVWCMYACSGSGSRVRRLCSSTI